MYFFKEPSLEEEKMLPNHLSKICTVKCICCVKVLAEISELLIQI